MTRRIDTKMSTAPAADNPESSPGAAAKHNDHVSAQQRWFQRLALLRNVLSLQNEPAYPGLQKQRAAFWSVSYPHTPWLLHNLRLLPKHSATAVAATQTREPPPTRAGQADKPVTATRTCRAAKRRLQEDFVLARISLDHRLLVQHILSVGTLEMQLEGAASPAMGTRVAAEVLQRHAASQVVLVCVQHRCLVRRLATSA